MARPRTQVSENAAAIRKAPDGYWHAYVLTGWNPDGTRGRKHPRRKDKTELVKAVREIERDRDSGVLSWTEARPGS